MSDRLELAITNRPADRARVVDALEQFARRHQIAGKPLHDLQLALEEHLTNISSYGYEDKREHTILIRAKLLSGELNIEIEDDARAFNPLTYPTPDLSAPIEQRSIGGIGIHMIRRSADALEYQRRNGKNLLTIRKRV
jgi:anti-sigma regulatory factor (Ser/Thr protein kinase)